MMNICIVEDEKEHYEIIKSYIKKCVGAEINNYQITWYQDGIDLVDEYNSQFDIIFLDIQMKHINGMEAAEKIRKLDPEVVLIFITSTVSYAVQGYSVDALGYVLKPVPFVAFQKLFEKAIERVKAKLQKVHIRVTVNDKQIKIDCDTVIYLESQRNNVIIHCNGEKYVTAGPLKKYEEKLSAYSFSKCHNAYLVNLAKVDAVQKAEIVLSDGTVLPISRARKKEFIEELTNDI